MKKDYTSLLNPLDRLPSLLRLFIALIPTLFVTIGRPLFPSIIEATPGAFYYPAVILAIWLGGFFPGFLSCIACSIYMLIYLRPHLLTEPGSDIPNVIRAIMFWITCLVFMLLIPALQKALKKAKDALDLRDNFLTLAAHELNTPLTALKLQLDVAKRVARNESGQRTYELIESSIRQVTRLERLISSMMDLTLFDSGQLLLKKEKIELNKVVVEVMKSVQTFQHSPEQIILNLCKNDLFCELDSIRIEQILHNIIHNAIKYGQGKTVVVSTGIKDQHVWISIADQGLGISKKDQENIFKRFHRSSLVSGIEGMGLGLYLSKMLVDLHNGEIKIQSEAGKGSIFTITFKNTQGALTAP